MKYSKFNFSIASIIFISIILFAACTNNNNKETEKSPFLVYTVSTPNPENKTFHVDISCEGWPNDTIVFEMAQWMPGYYQIMNYDKNVKNVVATTTSGDTINVNNSKNNNWQIVLNPNTPFTFSYQVTCKRKFVATNYLDGEHGYIVPPALFMYVKNYLDTPVKININLFNDWKNIATGLTQLENETNSFVAPNIDILFDCPILMGNLEQLPSFFVDSIEHKFIGYKMGNFDYNLFIDNLSRAINSAIDIIGEIPYTDYTFIAIGPGMGGIEHLNNTTVSFDGSNLNQRKSMIRMLSFLTHEYFHHYNVKRIRPFELGPFRYDCENRTNLLWVSEGITVYYEDIILARAGLLSEEEFISNLEQRIGANENNPGRFYQSLVQASYNTWSDGPFGRYGTTISYYQKGPLLGLILDLSIRNATQNIKSLDDVMRRLYFEYYRQKNRGFTDAEFQQVCEDIAGVSLNSEFEYVYTTKEIDFNKYLAYAGLSLSKNKIAAKNVYSLTKVNNPNQLQKSIFNGLQKKNAS